MYIKREIEPIIRRYSEIYPAILLTGQRQSGKSTVLKTMLDGRAERFVFDDSTLRLSAEKDPRGFVRGLKPPVILDEIQKCGSLFPEIKSYAEDHEGNGLFYLTGSQPYKLLKAAEKESLAGRVGILTLLPLSLREIEGKAGKGPFDPSRGYSPEDGKGKSDLWDLIYQGSFPRRVALPMTPREFYPSYVETYLKRDVEEEIHIEDPLKFDMFLRDLAAQTGQMVNLSNIAQDIGVAVSTLSVWAGVLAKIGIVYFLQPYSSSALSRATKRPKMYFMDTGLVAYFGKWSSGEVIKNGAMAGAFFETFVVSEIVKSFVNQGYDMSALPLYYYHGKDKIRRVGEAGEKLYQEAEIDLLLESGDVFYPVEIKKTMTPSPAMANAFPLIDRDKSHHRGVGTILCEYDAPLKIGGDLQILNPFCI
jgi:hypothetical protein